MRSTFLYSLQEINPILFEREINFSLLGKIPDCKETEEKAQISFMMSVNDTVNWEIQEFR